MSLRDEVAAAAAPVGGCMIGALIESLPPEEAAETRDVVDDPNLIAAAIHRALLKRYGRERVGVEGVLTRHRRKGCACWTKG